MENGLAAAEGEEKLFPDTHAQKVCLLLCKRF